LQKDKELISDEIKKMIYKQIDKKQKQVDPVWFNTVMILTLSLAVIFLMVGELLVGLIAIAVASAVGIGPIWHILRSERNTIRGIQTQMRTDMQNIINETRATNNRLEQIVLSGIDEKITVLGRCIDWINAWKSREDKTEIFTNAADSIKSDIRACAKYNSSMNSEQRTHLYGTLRRIIEALQNKKYYTEAGEIKDLKETLFPS
jgi:hypothetical protein